MYTPCIRCCTFYLGVFNICSLLAYHKKWSGVGGSMLLPIPMHSSIYTISATHTTIYNFYPVKETSESSKVDTVISRFYGINLVILPILSM